MERPIAQRALPHDDERELAGVPVARLCLARVDCAA